jgi:hypothetical protein
MQSFGYPTQTRPHYSLLSLMYGHQFVIPNSPSADQADDDSIQQGELAAHIEDFCDCV